MNPSLYTSKPLPSRFAGHEGMYTTEDGVQLIKPAYPSELIFYETLVQSSILAPLRPFIPKFYGTLQPRIRVNGADTTKCVSLGASVGRTQSLILENVAHRFLKPNTLDVKLGTLFYDDSTSPDKILRMEKTARETTSLETGVRLAEFQVYDNLTSEPIVTPKSFGKALRTGDLPDGIARFFPVGYHPPERKGPQTSGLPRRTLLPILQAIRENIVRIRDAYSLMEIRMVGASLLIIYEADWALAEEGVRRLLTKGEEDSDSRQPFVIKLIDFAHTRFSPGEGPDEGVLRGMDTMLKLLDGRIVRISGSQL